MEYHVAINGNDRALGDEKYPFRTISRAARCAKSGDKVIVHEGEYREWVKPENSGKSDSERIVYQAANGEKVIIKGSERIQNWQVLEGTIWKVQIPNRLFGEYNPFAESLWGDWLLYPEDGSVHVGDIYLNGKSLYEAKSLEEVRNPKKRVDGMNPPWTKRREQILFPEDTVYQWFAEVGAKTTILYANFQGKNPNIEMTEISVRKSCFFPEKTGRNYITVQGFEMAQAATPWAPPTAEQWGLLGVNWAKGWIIQDNQIHDAKCSGISIGKEYSTGHNDCTLWHRKPGYQYQMEAVFRAVQSGWSKEKIGSHVIRNNEIYDCGQNAIVGHLGCIFSKITDNHIYRIGVKHEFFGYEIAGIKLHAAIDVLIERNCIHHCTLGTWLDWEAQGTRISRNLFFENDRDLMIEVTHGPHLIDNNIFASTYNLDNIAQGGAYVHNLFCGTIRREPVLDRSTPYHLPHSTIPLGTAFVYGGDDRWIRNVFLGGQKTYTEQSKSGTGDYDGHPSSMTIYLKKLLELGVGDHDNFKQIKQSVLIRENCYLNGAIAYEEEQEAVFDNINPEISIQKEGGELYLNLYVSETMLTECEGVITTDVLGMPRITEEQYESPDGTPISLEEDYCGNKRTDKIFAGPFADLKIGWNRIKIGG